MQAIFLAAGLGSRLEEITKNKTKCMVEVNEVSLITRAINQLCNFSLKRVVVVIGHKGDVLKKHLDENIKSIEIVYIDNTLYSTTNNIFSLYLAREEMLKYETTLVLESDIIFDIQALDKIVSNPYPNLVLVDKYEEWMNGTAVLLNDDNYIIDFITDNRFRLKHEDSYYKTVNIYKFNRDFLKNKYIPLLCAYIQVFGHNHFYEQILHIITSSRHNDLKAVRLGGEKWYEIDNKEDLDIARTIFGVSENSFLHLQNRFGGYWRFPMLFDFCYLVNPFFLLLV